MVFLLTALALWAVFASEKTRWPEQGKDVVRDYSLKVDRSNIKDGYFYAWTCSKTHKKLKLRVIKDKTTLTYDLDNTGAMEVFPLQLGDGNYQISLYENVSRNSYSAAGTVYLRVRLDDPNSPFLYPNQYVNYSQDSEAITKADELCAGKTQKQAFDSVCSFMKSNIGYDFVKALTIKPGVLPDIDGSYSKRMGVCQDLSAIMVCMLRSQGIPAKLIIGYADKNYHAWIAAVINGEEKLYDPTAQIGAQKKAKKYTVERFY
jgi:Transglutaminase-like enzymes, putative cysteine proteases